MSLLATQCRFIENAQSKSRGETSAVTTSDNDTPLEIRDSLPHLIRFSYRRLGALYDRYVGHLGLTSPQFALMMNIHLAPDLEQSELGGQSGFDPATAGGMLGRLEKLGLIVRTRSTRSRRGRTVRLTAKGQHYMEEIDRCRLKLLRALVEPLSTEEEDQLMRLLTKLSGVQNSYSTPASQTPSHASRSRKRPAASSSRPRR